MSLELADQHTQLIHQEVFDSRSGEFPLLIQPVGARAYGLHGEWLPYNYAGIHLAAPELRFSIRGYDPKVYWSQPLLGDGPLKEVTFRSLELGTWVRSLPGITSEGLADTRGIGIYEPVYMPTSLFDNQIAPFMGPAQGLLEHKLLVYHCAEAAIRRAEEVVSKGGDVFLGGYVEEAFVAFMHALQAVELVKTGKFIDDPYKFTTGRQLFTDLLGLLQTDFEGRNWSMISAGADLGPLQRVQVPSHILELLNFINSLGMELVNLKAELFPLGESVIPLEEGFEVNELVEELDQQAIRVLKTLL